MNFLEQVIAEWFSYEGYFVKTNIKFGKLPRGGFTGEMDVVAFHPQTRELVHIETSTDALSWEDRCKRFKQKFESAELHYRDSFQFPFDPIRRIAIVGFGHTVPDEVKNMLGERIGVESVREFFRNVAAELRGRDPSKQAISENLPLLRAMQFVLHLGQEKTGHV